MSGEYEQKEHAPYAVRHVQSEMLREQYWEFRHKSGLLVQVFPKKRKSCAAMFTVHFGARDLVYTVSGGKETHVPQGVAHFLEHKLFTCPDGSDISERFASLGADSNAWTDWNQTSYFFTTTEHPWEALRILLHFVTHPYFTTQTIQKEQGIIAQEIRMEDDNPWEKLYRQTMRALYEHHPIRYPICGSIPSISNITPDMLYDCYKAFYRPDNMALTVCGDVTWEQVAETIDDTLGDWGTYPPGARPEVVREDYRENRPPKKHRIEGSAPLAKPLFSITVKDADIPKEAGERLRREVLMSVVSEVLFSRAGDFYNPLFESGNITQNYSYSYSITPEIAYHAVSGEADDPEIVWQTYLAFVEKVRDVGMREEDFERCRRVLYAGFLSEFDDPEDIADLMVEAQGQGYPVFARLEALREITLEQGNQLLRQVMDPAWTVLSVLRPAGQEDTAGKDR